ncbi:MAG: hypothetical protein AAFY60_06740 [Myxococcota bacterium]
MKSGSSLREFELAGGRTTSHFRVWVITGAGSGMGYYFAKRIDLVQSTGAWS